MSPNGWSLEVVRGRETGRTYALARGATVLGSKPDGASAINLGPQEGDGPRRMAPRQAEVDCGTQGMTLRDLDSPGGTFVNRQRVLPGQQRPLQPGDLIQLGSVQLKVVATAPPVNTRASTPPSPPKPVAPPPKPAQPKAPATAPAAQALKPGALSAAFVLASGASCRTWDDFLTISAQRWGALRDELVSGRLAAFLVSIQRSDLVPSPSAPGNADERLDAWLATLPTTRSCRPELEVHPATVLVRAVHGGGVTRQVVRITNVGYRLLRSMVRVEASAAGWIAVAPEFTRAPFVTVDGTDVPLEVRIPETLDQPKSGTVTIEGNGGSRRVEVRLERPPELEPIPEADRGTGGVDLVALVQRQPLGVRLAAGCVGALMLRLLVFAGALIPLGTGGPPRLAGALLMFAVLGALIAAWLAARRAEPRDVPPSAFAGGCAGALAAAVAVAGCRAIEPVVAPGGALSPWSAGLLWMVLGAGAAGLSTLLLPPRPNRETSP